MVSKPHSTSSRLTIATKLTLEYDGTRFAGWAAQPGRRTISSELETALGIVLREPVSLTVAGRTDSGVHALGQVVSFDSPRPSLRSLNAVLPDEIAALAVETVPDGFSARYDAVSRTYLYRLLARSTPSPFERSRSLWWPHSIDEEALKACADELVGTHDFTAFTPTAGYHQHFSRTILSAGWQRTGPWNDILEFRIEADAFMRHMNRVLVGTMLEVGGGGGGGGAHAPGLPPAAEGAAALRRRPDRSAARALPCGCEVSGVRVSTVVTIAFVGVLACGYFYVVAKVWRGESEYDPSKPPDFWPFSLPLWHGLARAFVVQGLCFLLLVGGGVAGDALGKDSAGYNWAMGIGLLGLLGGILIALPITFFNRPKFLVPPHQRSEPGTLAEWRQGRERRSPPRR